MVRRRAKIGLIAVVAVLLALAGVAAFAAVTFDPNAQKSRIADAVRRATGRDLQINGKLHVAWGLTPALEAQDVALANMPGGTRPEMAMAGRVEVRLALLPLLLGRVEIGSVTLVRPDILLETAASGRGNWQFDRPHGVAGPASPVSDRPRQAIILHSLQVEAGRVTWHDGVTGRSQILDVPHATLDLGAGATRLVAQAETAGMDVRVTASLGTQEQITGAAPFPVKLDLTAGDATLELDGTFNPSTRGVSGRVEAVVPDLARFGTLLQWTLPPLHDMRFAGTLPGEGGLPQDIKVHAGASDLGTLVPGAALDGLDLVWPVGQPARLEASGTLAAAPWHITSGLIPTGGGVALRAFSVSSGFGDASGDLAVGVSPRPSLRGTLISTRLDVDAMRRLAPATPAAPRAAATAMPASSSPPPGPPPLFSDTALPWNALRRADANVQLSIATLHVGGRDYHDASALVVLQDGVLRIDPASVQSPEGRVDFSASADSRPVAPQLAIALRSVAFAIDPLMQAFGLPGGSDASAEVDVALHAAGQSPHALAASLDGHVGVAVVDGELSNAALSQALGDMLRAPGMRLDPNGRSQIRCLALRADAQDGQVTLSALKLDTSRLLLEGGGGVDLAGETIALHLRPLLRLGGAGVLAPFRVDGPIRHPLVAMDAPSAGGRAGVVIGRVAGPADDCGPELTAARDGRPGRMPIDVPMKPVKPADLLRSLLR